MREKLKGIEFNVTKIFEIIFRFISNKISYTFSVAFTTSLYGFLIAVYTGIFLITTVNFGEGGAGNNFITIFIILSFAVYAPGHYIHFGLLEKIGIKCFFKQLTLINKHVKKGAIIGLVTESEGRNLLKAMEMLPKLSMYGALIYTSIVMIIVLVQEFIIGTKYSTAMIGIGILSAIFIYALITYVAAELLTDPMRRKVKRTLVEKKIIFEESYTFSIRHKFMFINLLTFVAMGELGLMFYFSSSKGLILRPILFIIVAVIMIGSILFFYLLSIESSLLGIEDASIDLAEGGKGTLFLGGLDREFVSTSKGFVSAASEVNDIRRNLEQKVKDRTRELNETMLKLQETLEEAQKLKNQQDGDYYLTSLLIDPLSMNKSNRENVTIDVFVKQKKTFSFRKWNKEIGGDICVSDNLMLKSKEYAVFLNADAMGKSIQGAGGALVLGAGFKAIVDRNRFSSIEQDQYPEHWLKNCVEELQRVFVSFDGAMSMSFVIGLVDNDNGVVYYINGEHPWSVLYRNDKAEFIENELRLRKLGIPALEEEKIMIKILKLENNNILITGSDGRDDILIADEKNNSEKMNDDEFLFLKKVEEGEGNLEKIYNLIESTGKITDDISLLRITYQNDNEWTDDKSETEKIIAQTKELVEEGEFDVALKELEEVYNEDKRNTVVLKNILKILINFKKDYNKAAQYFDKFLNLSPHDTDYLYTSSICFQKINNFKKALELAECAYLRNPNKKKYILQLAKVNIDTENYIGADQLLDEILKLDPNNKKAINLKNSL